MLRGRDPVGDELLELVRRHAGMRGHHDLENGRFAARNRAFHIPLEQRGKRFLVLPLRMLRRERLHSVERKQELKIHGLLGPQRAVVIEGGDAFCRRHELRPPFLRDFRDKFDEGLLRRTVIPRGKRIGGIDHFTAEH